MSESEPVEDKVTIVKKPNRKFGAPITESDFGASITDKRTVDAIKELVRVKYGAFEGLDEDVSALGGEGEYRQPSGFREGQIGKDEKRPGSK